VPHNLSFSASGRDLSEGSVDRIGRQGQNAPK
jgi:hypothetical protein